MIYTRCARMSSLCDDQDVRRCVVRLAGRSMATTGLCANCRAVLTRPPLNYDVILDRRANDLPWNIERRDWLGL